MVDKGKFTDFEEGRILVWEQEIERGIKKAQLPNKTPWVIRCYSCVSSTMDFAAKMVHPGKELCGPRSPALVLAKDQTSGRGRQGRSWQAASLGFYATYVFSGTGDIKNINCFPLVCACVIAEVLAEFSCVLSVKWPNDLLSVDGKKISGILIELVKGNDGYSLLVGIGVNLLGEPDNQPNATSVYSLTGRQITPPQLASRLSDRLYNAFLETEKSGFAPFKDRWNSLTKGIGKSLSVTVGDSIVAGIYRGANDLGHLLIEQDGVLREITSGEPISH